LIEYRRGRILYVYVIVLGQAGQLISRPLGSLQAHPRR